MAAPAQTASAGVRSFAYKSRDLQGNLVKGVVDAANEAGVVARLAGLGLSPVQITERTAGTGLNREISLGFLSKGVKLADLSIAVRQLATMVASGLPLLRAINGVTEQIDNAKLKALIVEVARDVETGSSFSDALARHPKDIPPIMISMLKAGEQGGFLDTALDSVATTFEKEVKLRSTIKSAMTYPVVVLCISALAVIAMLLFIVPIFKNMFASFGKSLPLPTELLVILSGQMWWFIPALIVAVIAGSAWWRNNKGKDEVRRVLHPLLLRVPVFGPLLTKVAIARFARNLANMTGAGVPLLRALTLVGQTSGNWVIEKTSERVAEAVRLGRSMTGPLAEEKLFPTMVVQMIAVGEESGSLDTMLGKVADFYDDQVEATASALTSLIEPLLITVLGVVVGGMIVALYLPIFDIISVVQGG